MTSVSHQLMQRETRVTLGPAPHALGGERLRERTWRLAGDAFLMRVDGEHYFHYRRGEGLTVERGRGADVAVEPLWLAGTVHAAIACLNGLIPIHASAIAYEGKAYAFTGHSGAGKSTLVAALGALGLPMVCDDTLVLDPAGADVMCLPGHKRLKLSREAIATTGTAMREPVMLPAAAERLADTDPRGKFYAVAPAGDVAQPLPLAALIMLSHDERTAITPVTGGARLRALLADHYTVDLLAAAGGGARAVFDRLGPLAGRIEMFAYTRPRDLDRLSEGAAGIVAWLQRRDRDDGTGDQQAARQLQRKRDR